MGTARVEVPQQSTVPLLERLAGLLCIIALSLDEIRNDQFDRALGASVGVGRPDWAVLRNGDHVGYASGIAVDSRRGGEDDVGHVMLGHASQERDGSAYVDAVVFEGFLTRFTHSLE